ncbi:hypothetical protein J6590_072633 [Homalodisca vitripennis]|nr:hypothetical protein J6590_072633 [Homalodisca vitripennis]
MESLTHRESLNRPGRDHPVEPSVSAYIGSNLEARVFYDQEIRHGSSYACKCLPSCNDIDFDTETHWRPWQFKVNSTFASVPAAVDLNSTAVSLMAIAVKKKYLNKTKRTALIGSAAYVANIGGILSLFLGISFLSLFEVVYFITLRVLINFWNMKKREAKLHKQQCWIDNNFKKQPFKP